MARRETENNAYAKFWGDKQKTLWYVMVFSGVVNSTERSAIQKGSVQCTVGAASVGHLLSAE